MNLKSLLSIFLFAALQISGYGQIKYEGTLDDGLNSILLDNGEIKYAVYNKSEKTLVVYNSDHSEWKSVLLPIPRKLYFDELKSISVNVFNPDTLIELAYTCVEYLSNNELESTTNYVDVLSTLFVINEEGALILEAENCSHMEIVDSKGARELWVYKQVGQGADREEHVDVYSLPDYQITNKQAEQSDENKYHTFVNPCGI